MRIVNIIGWMLLITAMPACKKFLDKPSNESFSTPSTLGDLQRLLDNTDNMNLSITPNMPEASSNDYFLTDAVLNTRSEIMQSMYVWEKVDYFFSNDWAAGYTPVYYANLILESLEKIGKTPATQQEWNAIRGAALFHRAYSFLELTWAFAEAYDDETADSRLAIDLRLSSDFNIPSVRSTVREAYDRVLQDAKLSASLLPAQSSHVVRPTKAAAFGLLARAYLSMRNYDSAYVYANKALLEKDMLVNYNTIANSASPFAGVAYTGETIFFATMKYAGAFDLLNTSRALIDTTLYDSYDNNDLRKTLFFRANGSYQSFKGTYNTSNTRFFSGIATDELYLMRAECAVRKNNVESALNDLNKLLETRFRAGTYVNYSSTDQQEVLTVILNERRKQLLMRGLRWMDIKRLNKEGADIIPTRIVGGIAIKLQPNSSYYALPLPADIISLTGMPQN